MSKLDQEQLRALFYALKEVIAPFERGTIKARTDIEGKYDLWSVNPGMVILGRKRDEIGFVTLVQQSSYVGFYYMPICTNESTLGAKIAPELMKQLKGKACFHIKTADPQMIAHVAAAMELGYKGYIARGWAK